MSLMIDYTTNLDIFSYLRMFVINVTSVMIVMYNKNIPESAPQLLIQSIIAAS